VTTSPTLSFTVLTGPSITTPTSNPVGSIDLGQPVTFSTSASGGSGSYHYTWSGLPTGCPGTSSASVGCTPTATGVFTVTAAVVDSLGGSASSATLVFTVHSDPTIGPLTVSPRTIDLGQTFRFSLLSGPIGGAGPFRYIWTGLPDGCVTNNSIILTCTPTDSASGETTVTVYDANNGTDSATVPYLVYIRPSLPDLAANPGSIDLGQNVTFWALAVGGSGNFTYQWSGLPSGCAALNRSSIECVPTLAGSVEITLNITDSDGVLVGHSFAFTVNPDPSVSTPTASPGSATTGQSVTFSATASGGSGVFSYSWIGLPPGCHSANASTVTCQPSSAGSYEVTVNVTDSSGYHVLSGALRFSVAAPPSLFGLPAFEAYSLIAGVAGIVALFLAVALVRRSRRRRGPPPS
jgi:hypothetical protein